MGIGLFLLGALLYRTGVFLPHRVVLRRWLVAVGFGVALPLDAVINLTDLLGEGTWGSLGRYGTAPVVALGVLALVAEFYQRRSVGRVGGWLQVVGSMALTCYLLQNVLGVVFQHTLLRTPLMSHVNYALQTGLLFAGIVVVMVVFSKVWMSGHRRGPVELVWVWSHERLVRVLTRRR